MIRSQFNNVTTLHYICISCLGNVPPSYLKETGQFVLLRHDKCSLREICRLCYTEEIWHHEKNTGISGRCKNLRKPFCSLHDRLCENKLHFWLYRFSNLNKTRSKINIGSSVLYTVQQMYSSPPLSLFATFRPLTAAGFES